MILGKIIGKVSTTEFKFKVEKETKKFEYVQVYHKAYEYILCQIIELETDDTGTTAYCQILGFKENGRIKKPRIPLEPGSEVIKAEDDFIKKVVELETDFGGLLGDLDGKDIPVSLDLNKVLSMHMAVLAKSGSGKSYTVGVLLEEMMDKNIPILIIDPHGEYSSLRFKNTDEKDIHNLTLKGLEPTKYAVHEYGDPDITPGIKPLTLSVGDSQEELVNLLPGKLSSSQQALLYSALKSSKANDFDSLIISIESEESNAKYGLISMIEYLRDLKIFNSTGVNYAQMVSSGKCTILNLKGVDPLVQEMIVYKVSKELFELRKKNKVPPFFLVLEEAHNYCPERSFGETKASKTLRTIASEGRKFGLGLCVVSQRPARVDKSVLSQCSTQVIMKVTNPNDLKALSSSVEGITTSTEKEIQNLVIGQSLVTGVTDMPLLVNVRARKSLHGGVSQTMNAVPEDDHTDFSEQTNAYAADKVMPLIKPSISSKDVLLMSENGSTVNTTLIPAKLLDCKDKRGMYKLLLELKTGGIVTNVDNFEVKYLPDMSNLSPEQVNILKHAFKHKKFDMNLFGKNSISSLLDKNYLVKSASENSCSLSNKYIFTKLINFQTHSRIEHEGIKYNKIYDINVDEDFCLEQIERFTTVTDKDDCYILKYEVKKDR